MHTTNAIVGQVFLLLFLVCVNGFGVEIPAGRETCFFREIHSSVEVTVSYVARETIDVIISDPTDTQIFRKRSVLEGEHTFITEHDGAYQICVGTETKRRAPTITHFRFLITDHRIPRDQLATKGQTFSAEQICREIIRVAESVLFAAQVYSDANSGSLIDIKASSSLVRKLVVLQFVAVLAVALAQITFIRKVLSTGRGKLQRIV